ncbi:unnamed protein product [Durusdinium trenchii]|uniref:Uncharacterized protein n=1 Tax=Durusdinium trenchii TaxID=1381693 RepID=A0ABP0PTD6_9DINO
MVEEKPVLNGCARVLQLRAAACSFTQSRTTSDRILQPKLWHHGAKNQPTLSPRFGQPNHALVALVKGELSSVLPLAGCVVNHPSLMRAVKQLQEVFNSEGVGVFDHDSATARGIFEEESARYVELTLERPSGAFVMSCGMAFKGRKVGNFKRF